MPNVETLSKPKRVWSPGSKVHDEIGSVFAFSFPIPSTNCFKSLAQTLRIFGPGVYLSTQVCNRAFLSYLRKEADELRISEIF